MRPELRTAGYRGSASPLPARQPRQSLIWCLGAETGDRPQAALAFRRSGTKRISTRLLRAAAMWWSIESEWPS